MKKSIVKYVFISGIALFFACKEEDAFENQAPDTFFVIDNINVSGKNRLNTIVDLSWFGTDPDGFVKSFEISNDGQNWKRTSEQDTTFNFSIPVGLDTTDIEVYIRAIDNMGLRDPIPDYLRIPIKNTAPEATFDNSLSLPDTAFLVATTKWDATDIDGDESITNVLISLNGIDWFEMNKREKEFSIVAADPEATDTTEGLVYYGTNNRPEAASLKGLVMNDTNRIFIKSIDEAGTESKIDTSTTFYMKGKVKDLLVVGGIGTAHRRYKDRLRDAMIEYDFLDLTVDNGINQPAIWNITFKLQLLQYSKLFFYSDETFFINPYTNVKQIILEFAASSLQEYANTGGKYLITTYFDHDQSIEGFRGVLPIQSLSSKNYADASLLRDSLAIARDPTFPSLRTQKPLAITKLGVFNIDTNDTDIFYTAQLSDKRVGSVFPEWPDTKIMASARPKKLNASMKYNQIFFSMQLWELNGDKQALIDLFDEIFNKEFQ